MLIQNREITHPDVTMLVRASEEEINLLYPDETNAPLSPHARFVVAYVFGEPVGCGALVPAGPGVGEVKRMYVRPTHRRTGIARRILSVLERRAKASDLDTLILETGVRQPEALALYEAQGYLRTEPFGEYIDNPNSICLAKKLSAE